MLRLNKISQKRTIIYRILDRMSFFALAGGKKYYSDDEKDEFMRTYILSKKLFEKDQNELGAFIKSTISYQMKYLLYKVLCFIDLRQRRLTQEALSLDLAYTGN